MDETTEKQNIKLEMSLDTAHKLKFFFGAGLGFFGYILYRKNPLNVSSFVKIIKTEPFEAIAVTCICGTGLSWGFMSKNRQKLMKRYYQL